MRGAVLAGLTMALLTVGSCHRKAPTFALAISVPYQVDTLDPHAIDRLGNAAIASHFYEALVTFDPEMRIQPALAERWESPDVRTWIFHLRTGVRFHGGRAFTADDVVHTFERLAGNPSLELGLYAAHIQDVRALDPLTVEFKTRRPLGILLNKLAAVFIVPRGDESRIATHPDGTGPYRLVSFDKGRVVMKRNDAYRGPLPAVRDVTIRFNRRAAEAAADFSAGHADIAEVPNRDAVKSIGAPAGNEVARREELFVKYLGFDTVERRSPFVPGDRNPFASRSVREAVALAIDRQALVAGLPTLAVPASQLVPRFIFGYDPALPGIPYAPERARRLLAEAGFPKGFDVTLHTRPRFSVAARLIAEQLSRVEIRVTVVEVAEIEYFDLAARGGLSLGLSSFGCASGDVSDLLESGFHSLDEARRFGTKNLGRYSDPSLDDAIERSAEILEPSERREVLAGVVRRVMNEYIWVPLYVDESVYAVRRPFVFRPRANSYVLASEVTLAP